MKSVCSLRPYENECKQISFISILLAGSISGFVSTSVTYPLDTLKTRLQSASGFMASGGFRGIYRGFLVISLGAIPINGVFFSTYETIKHHLEPQVTPNFTPWLHVCTASCARMLSCFVRVPIEIVKQRQQTVGLRKKSAIGIWKKAYRTEGIRRGLFRGFASTAMRDTPFSFIEMPIWELLKSSVRKYTNTNKLSSVQSAACGVVAGGVAGAITTPLDLVKTRIILEDRAGKTSPEDLRIRSVMRNIYLESGIRGLFAGVVPRVTMLMIGGFIFYAVYEEAKDFFDKYFIPKDARCEK